MEVSALNTLLDDIEQFGLLFASDTKNAELVQRYFQEIDGQLKCLKTACDEIVSSEIISEVQSWTLLQEIDVAVNEAKDLIHDWHPMMSKIYFVLRMENKITKIQKLMLEFFQLLSSLLPSLQDNSAQALEHVKQVHHESVSLLIIEAIRDQSGRSSPRPELLVKISNFLSLSTNQELLMEAVALEKLKVRAGRSENDEVENIEHMIDLVNYMHDCFVKVKQLRSINGVPIPADFCCPLSLELMSDPVIVASGQTYERAFIHKWLDQGFNVCPKTRQTLGHTNLIPNYTVKALIANWCETNNIKLPDPIKSASSSIPIPFIGHSDSSVNSLSPIHSGHSPRFNRSRSPEPNTNGIAQKRDSYSYNGVDQDSYNADKDASNGYSLSALSPARIANGDDLNIARISPATTEEQMTSSIGEKYNTSVNQNDSQSKQDYPPTQVGEDQQGHSRAVSTSGAISSNDYLQGTGSSNAVSSDLTHYSSDTSGELGQGAPVSSAAVKEPDYPPRLGDNRSRSQNTWRRPVPRIVSSGSMDSRTNLSAVETQVRKLIEDLKTDSVDVLRTTTSELRLLAKHNMENRIIIANCGAINLLVSLLHSTDPKTQENAVTALLNLSINDNNKTAIANADAIDPLIHVLETGTPEAKENAAATLFSLSVIEENKVKIGRSRAIKPLVELLGNGTPRGKKDAATALFNLSIFHENKTRIVQAGAVKHLVDLMDPAFGMVDKAVAVLANLATIAEGRTAIGLANGIPILVEVVELGSARGKENAAAALLQLCTNSSRFCTLVLQEGAVPPLVALSQSGTPRAKEKAQALLGHFRSQRHANAGRS